MSFCLFFFNITSIIIIMTIIIVNCYCNYCYNYWLVRYADEVPPADLSVLGEEKEEEDRGTTL